MSYQELLSRFASLPDIRGMSSTLAQSVYFAFIAKPAAQALLLEYACLYGKLLAMTEWAGEDTTRPDLAIMTVFLRSLESKNQQVRRPTEAEFYARYGRHVS